MGRSLPRAFYRILAVILLAANLLVWRLVLAPRRLGVEVISAGKGTAVLVRAPSGGALLVNAGPDASILRALGTRLPPWERSLVALILTDLSARAAGGAPLVLSRYQTPLIVRPQAKGTRTSETAFAQAAEESRLIYGERGTRLSLGGAYADILWPPKAGASLSGESGSLAILISDGVRSYLIYDNLPVRIVRTLPAADVTIASGTPPGIY